MSARVVRIGLLGFGTVGRGVYNMLSDNRSVIEKRAGLPIEITRIAVRDLAKERDVPAHLITTDCEAVVNDPEIDVIIEVIGGLEPAYDLIRSALQQGKSVVTANKELMAKHGSELLSLAAQNDLDLHLEAAVGGGIPLIQPLKHQLAGNDILRLVGILNGTTNFILSKIEEGGDFEQVLAEAQALGYAEADPTADVDAFDTTYKISILASIAFGSQVNPSNVSRQGIRSITRKDVEIAETLGFRIKLVGVAEPVGDQVLVRVHPALVAHDHPLASVRGVYNALWVQGDFVGSLMFSGRGAGGDATASAIIGDLIDIVRNIDDEGKGSAVPYATGGEVASMDDLVCRYYLRIRVSDRPRVLGEIAQIFGLEEISISTMEMRVLGEGEGEITFLTHPAREANVQAALRALKSEPGVIALENRLRVLD